MGMVKDMINERYPGGVYIAMKPTPKTLSKIEDYIKTNLKDVETNKDIHCTLIYSQKKLKGNVVTMKHIAEGSFAGFELFGPNKDTLVIKLDSPDLIRRNDALVKQYDFISDYEEYRPHVTLAYGCEGINLKKLPPLDFTLYFTNEYVEPLDTDWAN